MSVAMSIALKGIRLARKIVSSRDVAVTMCEEPAVRDVKMYRAGSSAKCWAAMAAAGCKRVCPGVCSRL